MKMANKFLLIPAAAALMAGAMLPATAQMAGQNTPGHPMGGMMHHPMMGGGMMHGKMMHHPMMKKKMMHKGMTHGKMMHHPMMKKGMPGTAVGGGTGMNHPTPGGPM